MKKSKKEILTPREKLIKEWDNITNKMVLEFILVFFDSEAEFYWVSDDVGGICVINDYFFTLEDIITAIKYDTEKNKLYDYLKYVDLSLDTEKGEMKSFRQFLSS